MYYKLNFTEFTGVDPRVLSNQVPGGMISNLSNQLKDQDALDKMDDVLKEIPEVRKDLGCTSPAACLTVCRKTA